MSKSIITTFLVVASLAVLTSLLSTSPLTAAPAEAPPAEAPAPDLGAVSPAAAPADARPEAGKAKKPGDRNQPGARGKRAEKPGDKEDSNNEAKARKKNRRDRAESGEENTEASEHEEEAEEEDSKESKMLAKLRAEVELLNMQRDKLLAENVIAEEAIKKELSEREAATEVIEMEVEEAELEIKRESIRTKLALEKELKDLRTEKERLVLEAEIAKARSDAEISRLKLEEEERRGRLSTLNSEISVKEATIERNNYTEESPVYLANPVQGKKLVISDRRIALNGLIGSSSADHVSERINYFNNKDSKMPIFIVIDNSPGGSVMSGYKILKAMEGSAAPVYVVVKSYAASMAACITTLAEKSFAYPNAVILHHQISGMSYGNLTRQKEFVEEAEEWWLRLAGPIAKEMGVTLEEFVDLMYENASTGDWVEFADDARKLNWVDIIIEEIHETSLIKNPDADSNGEDEPSTYYGLEEEIDDDGRPFVTLPRLSPFDYYWLYNPDGYYR